MNTHPSSIYRRHHSPSWNFIHGGPASVIIIPLWNFIYGGLISYIIILHSGISSTVDQYQSSSSHSGISSTVDQYQSSSSHSRISFTVDQHQSSSSHSGILSTVDQRQSSSSQAKISFAAKTTNLVVYYNIQVAYNTTKSFPTLEFHPRWTNISH